MLKLIELENFRGFQKIKLAGLSRINVITGLNGAGKTSLLEAIFLICGGANAALAASLYGFRGDRSYVVDIDRPFRSLFKDLDPSLIPTLMGSNSELLKTTKKHRRYLQIKPTHSISAGLATTAEKPILSGVTFEFTGPSGKKVSKFGWSKRTNESPTHEADQVASPAYLQFGGEPVENPDRIDAQFVSPYVRDIESQDNQMLTQLVTERRIHEVVDVLKIIHPALVNLHPLSEGSRPIIYADIGGKNLLPLSLLGSGLSNCMHIVLPSVIQKNAVILIDEFEDGLHHSLYAPLLKIVFELARKNNNQIFISTHSNEFLNEFYSTATNPMAEDIMFFRLSRLGMNGVIPKYSLSEAHSLLEANMDIR